MRKIQALETGLSFLWKTPKGKINPKTLGYVCPDGAINFATEEAAVQYAKNKCVKAAQNGYEYGGLRHKNRIILEKIGDENCVDFGRVKINIPKGTELFHDHPGKKANPLSFQDYCSFIRCPNLFSIIAYDSNGAYSKFVKTAEVYKQKAKTIEKDSKIMQFFRKVFINKSKKETADFIKILNLKEICKKDFNDNVIGKENIQKLEEIDKLLTKIENGSVQCTEEEFNALESQIDNILVEAQTGDGALKIHNLWLNNDTKYGVKYSTNFPHLS